MPQESRTVSLRTYGPALRVYVFDTTEHCVAVNALSKREWHSVLEDAREWHVETRQEGCGQHVA